MSLNDFMEDKEKIKKEIFRAVPKTPVGSEETFNSSSIGKVYAINNLQKADDILALHLGPKHPIRLQLIELILKISEPE